jgi:hypothetical protein
MNSVLLIVVYIMAMIYGSKMIENHYTIKLGKLASSNIDTKYMDSTALDCVKNLT